MPTNVLVPLDGSELAFAGLEYCFESFPDASVTALFVVDPSKDDYAVVGDAETPDERRRAAAERVLERARDRAEDRGRALRTETRTGSPHAEILEYAAEEAIDHVAMGSHGESPITRPFLGHVSEAVVRRGSVSTTVVSERPEELRVRDLPGRILVPIDGSEQALAALAYALEEFPEADHTALHVVDLPFDYSHNEVEGTYLEPVLEDLDERAEGILESATALADDRGASVDAATAYGKPAAEIVDYAEGNGFDQIVAGGHGRSLAARLVTGSVAETIVERTPLAVTLVRGSPHGT